MRIPEALKRLKKKLKRKRGWMLAAAAAAIAAGIAAAALQPDGLEASPADAAPVPVLAAEPAPVTVVLHKRFLCGEARETLGTFGNAQIDQLRRDHPEWQEVKMTESEAIFSVQVNDLSPACKEIAHFGVDPSGYLTLYEGTPQEGKAVRSYFRIDMDAVRENLPEHAAVQLQEGIRVTDYAEYNSVLSSYSDFAAPEP